MPDVTRLPDAAADLLPLVSERGTTESRKS